ncbi:sensor histidine kinase [Geovibrio thiophilus]|uniref:sensor histidine kinase n=1 Tax=Geovibrio thiophilus TaxID=139438 RepID=UPI0013E3E7BC|nr:PAS domain-containing sensor histidine kinase [Geovibrio thiophilus]
MEENENLHTFFASAQRTPHEEIVRKAREVRSAPYIAQILDSLPDTVAVLDENRQIIFANKLLLTLLGLPDQEKLIGMRPGEALACMHAFADGCPSCGTTEYCSQCGAVGAILGANLLADEIKECRIVTEHGDAFDLLVTTRIIPVNNSEYILFIAKNIADEKRRIILERIFYHDISNLAGVIHTMSDILKDSPPPADCSEYHSILYGTSKALVEEVQSHRLLSLAESKELVINIERADSLSIAGEAVMIYSNHSAAFQREVAVAENSEQIFFETDKTILRRVLGNMIKNALEASLEGEKVITGCYRKNENAVFFVHNNGFMPKDVQLQVFQRSFSTKGKGRGLGTYSIKLLAENYLKGKVRFETSKENGTTFFAELPLSYSPF